MLDSVDAIDAHYVHDELMKVAAGIDVWTSTVHQDKISSNDLHFLAHRKDNKRRENYSHLCKNSLKYYK